MQHAINCHREERQISQPGGTAIREKASNLLHLSRRKGVSFANLKTFVPGWSFGPRPFSSAPSILSVSEGGGDRRLPSSVGGAKAMHTRGHDGAP
jgi:hypothetical protein